MSDLTISHPLTRDRLLLVGYFVMALLPVALLVMLQPGAYAPAAVFHTFVNLSHLPTIGGVDPAYVDHVLAGGFLVGAILVFGLT